MTRLAAKFRFNRQRRQDHPIGCIQDHINRAATRRTATAAVKETAFPKTARGSQKI